MAPATIRVLVEECLENAVTGCNLLSVVGAFSCVVDYTARSVIW